MSAKYQLKCAKKTSSETFAESWNTLILCTNKLFLSFRIFLFLYIFTIFLSLHVGSYNVTGWWIMGGSDTQFMAQALQASLCSSVLSSYLVVTQWSWGGCWGPDHWFSTGDNFSPGVFDNVWRHLVVAVGQGTAKHLAFPGQFPSQALRWCWLRSPALDTGQPSSYEEPERLGGASPSHQNSPLRGPLSSPDVQDCEKLATALIPCKVSAEARESTAEAAYFSRLLT